MSRQHPWPHVTGNRILILILVSEILDHCQNLLDDPRNRGNQFAVWGGGGGGVVGPIDSTHARYLAHE